ncbi:hypothetical protein [Zavarzinella formosa]|uniref:hypothetical protein n=1 Tax=Zavarzinella formosa TaxID=360055 RepID=UPI0002ED2ADE|nr:hypothetical protein [Zavarzinella formosa]
MIEVTILLPADDNDGKPFTPHHDDEYFLVLAELFGGFSLLPNLVKGGWIDKGVFYPDRNRQVIVSLDSITKGNLIREAVDYAKVHYNQLAIYISYYGNGEKL